jgi:hypothetical protein
MELALSSESVGTGQTFVEVDVLIAITQASVVSNSLQIAGTTSALKIVTSDDGQETITDISGSLIVDIKFGGSATLHRATTTNGGKNWFLTKSPIPFGNADANGNLLVTAVAKVVVQTTTHTQSTSTTVDIDMPPSLTINKPAPGEIFVVNLGAAPRQAPVPLEVMATDDRGVSELRWSLNNQNYDNQMVNQISLPVGKHTIFVRVRDQVQQTAEKSVDIEVKEPFVPVDSDNVTALANYFNDLLTFAARRIKTFAATAVAEAETPNELQLDSIFFQRFHELQGMFAAQNTKEAALLPVNHARICADALRGYINSQLAGQQPTLLAIEAEYRRLAYDALLQAMGTSHEELRLALTGDENIRSALAQRLRVGSEVLADLLLPRDTLQETDLRRVFGLAEINTIANPFAPTEQPPALLAKRRIYLRAAWQSQDDATRHAVFDIAAPVIDPDLVTPQDLSTKKALDLWTERHNDIEARMIALRGKAHASLSDFGHTLDEALGAGSADKLMGTQNAKGLFDRYGEGHDVEPEIHSMRLELAPFLYLLNINRMLSNAVVPLNDEWEQVCSILVQVVKLRDLYVTWRAVEVGQALRLGPDDFKLPEADAPVNLPAWRATQAARQSWLARLAARFDQSAALEEELRAMVDAAEARAMPSLRDSLIQLIRAAVNHGEGIDTADKLTAELLIDFKSARDLKTNRVEQAVETLQSILFAVRMRQLPALLVTGAANPAAAWTLEDASGYNAQTFDEEWLWMGSYAAWVSAMSVFLFPQNSLRPIMRPLPGATPQIPAPQTQDFNNLARRLRETPHLTRKLAREEAATYLTQLKQHISLANTVLCAQFALVEPVSLADIETLRNKINSVFNNTTVFPTAPQKFHDAPAWVQEVFCFVPLLLAEHLERSGEYLTALNWYQAVYAYTVPTNPKIYKGLILEADDGASFVRGADWLSTDFNPHKIALTRGNVYTTYVIMSLARCLLASADDLFTQETPESLAQARSLYLTALGLLKLPEIQATSQFDNKTLENSLVKSLLDHADSHLRKLRGGLNIAGLERPRRADDRSRTVTRYPTPYRYPVLIERAKQLAATAAQIEAGFLAALEKADAERYALLQAQQDIESGRAQVQLQTLRVAEAEDSVQLMRLQKDRARIQVEHFERLLEQDLLPEEKAMRRATKWANALKAAGGILAIGASVAATLATGGATAPVLLGALAGLSQDAINQSHTGATLAGVGHLAGVAGGIFAGRADTKSMLASFERRRQDWRLQLSLSQQDISISDQQIRLAIDQAQIAQQELKIASIQIQHALNTLNFLSNKFAGAELYDFMSQVLENIYAFFLRNAAAIARLAEEQLAYERQEIVPTFIRADYWRTSEGSLFGASGGSADRRGLTGSARLMRDITELDQFAFTTDSRKLQLSKTFSLAALDPVAFQRFLETGVMQFATLMDHFDKEFPGHYLRLIKRVRVSVIALTPPAQGIRATLSNLGVSRVVIDDNGFRPVVVNHRPQSVALSAPLNASGIFDFGDTQSEMLAPFEAIGVHSNWVFSLPKPANPFDFDTIADVFITFDYTAFDSSAYRKQVIENLSPIISVDQPFSLRNQFPDQWYDLHNPEQTDTPIVIRFPTTRADFPPHIDVLGIQHLSLVLSGNGETALEMPSISLRFRERDSTDVSVGGEAVPYNGIVSTRRGAMNWQPILGKLPIGVWELALQNTQFRDLLRDDKIEDMLLVVTYQGRLPAWPA